MDVVSESVSEGWASVNKTGVRKQRQQHKMARTQALNELLLDAEDIRESVRKHVDSDSKSQFIKSGFNQLYELVNKVEFRDDLEIGGESYSRMELYMNDKLREELIEHVKRALRSLVVILEFEFWIQGKEYFRYCQSK